MVSRLMFCSDRHHLQKMDCLVLPHRYVTLPRTLQFPEFRSRKRRPPRSLKVSSSFITSSFQNFFKDIFSNSPLPGSLDLIAPGLAAASGLVLYFFRRRRLDKGPAETGNWVLITSPTPFNRFVFFRCPSISIEQGDLPNGVRERLVKEDRHFVTLDRGRILAAAATGADSGFVRNLTYQRVCIGTDDGGVISLDWPVDLELNHDDGLDTTVLIIAGTTEGSKESNVQSFVCDALAHGCFPVVMNPRGCAGSPLTTARLFTAADSDDIRTAIQFVNKSRPWATLMGIGWGYGANMLTKYLGEVGENTPLTAAVCIDNPFDLEEATRSFPYHIALDQKLSHGLREILRTNKELFQGRDKEFNVENGLSATTVRDFEKAISMFSFGFEAIEEFYGKCGSRHLVGSLRIPVLFMQNDNGTVPPFSIPRGAIAENPFTSLLLCSYLPSNIAEMERSANLWCQHLAIEWFSSVELALLKGRHPLLRNVDITVKPSKGLTVFEGREKHGKVSSGKGSSQSILSYGDGYKDCSFYDERLDILSGFQTDQFKNMLEELQNKVEVHSDLEMVIGDSLGVGNIEPHQLDGGIDGLQKSDTVKAEKENGKSLSDNERSQAIRAAEFVMNMLDASAPGTLIEEQRKEVISAMEQGETFIKALQGAFPDDVREKLTSAVSEIVRAQGVNLNFDEFKANIKQKFKGLSNSNDGRHISHSSDTMNGVLHPEKRNSQGEIFCESNARIEDDSAHHYSYEGLSNNGLSNQTDAVKSSLKAQYDAHPSLASQKSDQTVMHGMPTHPNIAEKANGIDDAMDEQLKMSQNYDAEKVVREPKNENLDTANSSCELLPNDEAGKSHPLGLSSPEVESLSEENGGHQHEKNDNKSEQLMPSGGKVGNNDEKGDKNVQSMPSAENSGSNIDMNEDKNIQSMKQSSYGEPSPAITSSSSPSINVAEALDVLEGFDDPTQMAVNSVFGVIENMIDQLEKPKQHDDKSGSKNDNKGSESSDNASKVLEEPIDTEFWKEDNEDELNKQPNSVESSVVDSHLHECTETIQDVSKKWMDEVPRAEINLLPVNSTSDTHRDGSYWSHYSDKYKTKMQHSTNPFHFLKNSNKINHVCSFPQHASKNPLGDSVYIEYLRKFFHSKVLHTSPSNLDLHTDLYLEFFPEEGKWKVLDRLGSTRESAHEMQTHKEFGGAVMNDDVNNVIGNKKIVPTYLILDRLTEVEPMETLEHGIYWNEKGINADITDEIFCLFRNTVLNQLMLEVGRRLGILDMKTIESNIAHEVEQVAEAVAIAIKHGVDLGFSLETNNPSKINFDAFHGEFIIQRISLALLDTKILKKVLPVGVVFGSSLAALGNYFSLDKPCGDYHEQFFGNPPGLLNEYNFHEREIVYESFLNNSKYKGTGKVTSSIVHSDSVMMGDAAAIGASALLLNGKDPQEEDPQEEHGKVEEEEQGRNQNNVVSSLAQKAMSVAAPVVPTKSDGKVDHERLVAMLGDLGQKVRMLRLIGKAALLWGGIRSAMSLTDRLLSFFHIAERPLFQRILGFVCMLLLLWSPVAVPLIPTLVQNLVARSSNGIAEYRCTIGLYTAAMILVIIWGKRIRGYVNPLGQYGLNLFSSPKLYDFLKGLAGGVLLTISIHALNASLGCACFSWPASSSLTGSTMWLKMFGNMLILTIKAVIPATGVAIVEELLFRSWLPEEIAVDFGYHRAIVFSGLVFSLIQRTPSAVPGLWLLSLALSGAKQRCDGDLCIPIGLRTGITTANFILNTGGLVKYWPHAPLWITGSHPWQPLGGIIGLTISAALAVFLYPRHFYPAKNPKVYLE